MGFSCRLVGRDVSCLPGVAVVGEGCAVGGRGSASNECQAYGIGALASCELQSQGWHASCRVRLCQPRLAGRISSIKAGVLWKALRTLLHPPALCGDTQDRVPLPFPPLISSPNSSAAGVSFTCRGVSGIWTFVGDGGWSVWRKMDGAGLRLGSKRRYFAAGSKRLQGSRMLHGRLCLGVWQPCLTCLCLPRATKRGHGLPRAPLRCGGESCGAGATLSSRCRRPTGRRQKDHSK